MNLSKTLSVVAVAAASVCGVHQAAHAHGAWMGKIHGDYHVLFGHDPSNTGAYKPAEVTEARGVKNGQVQALPITRAEKFASIDAGDSGMVASTMVNGFRAQTTDGKYHSLTKDEAAKLGEIKSSAYRTRYMVVYANNREEPKALGYELELLPQTNPGKFKKGDTVPVQVLYKGKPVPNAVINNNFLAHHQQKITADAQGRAAVPIANYGYNAWEVSHSVPYPDLQKADTNSYTMIVTFTAPGPSDMH